MNVNLIAIAAGALLYLLHVSLPAPITSTLSSVDNMIGPMGMLLASIAMPLMNGLIEQLNKKKKKGRPAP